MTDNHITFRLYIPLGMIILLMIMIFFHRNHMHKYLYIISSLCLFVAVLAYCYDKTSCRGQKARSIDAGCADYLAGGNIWRIYSFNFIFCRFYY